jgi:signal transduction histidine kinase
MPRSPRTDLYAALLELCEEFRVHGDIDCEVALDESHTRLAADVGPVVFRTVRELLANVRRHAQARRVRVSSERRRDGSIGITVADDGIGLPPHRRRGTPFDDKSGSGGTGLWVIDRRLRDFGAMLDVDAAAGRGTSAMLILPADLVRGD